MSSPRCDYSRLFLGSRVWLCGVMLLFTVIVSRAEQLPVRVYTTADGLGSSSIIQIVRDSRGFLWFCTRDGLSRFDGVRFTTYEVGRNPSYPTINQILETSRAGYLIATSGGGIYRFNPNAVPAPDTPETEPEERVTLNAEKISEFDAAILHEDRRRQIWAAGDRLYRVEASGKGLSFQKVDLNIPERSGKAFAVLGLQEARDDSLWLIEAGSAIRRLPDGRTIQYVLPTSSGEDAVTALEEDRDGRIWIGHQKGFYVLRPEPLASLAGLGLYTERHLPNRKTNIANMDPDPLLRLQEGEAIHFDTANGARRNPVRGLLRTSDGRIWLADDRGMTVFDGQRFRSFNNAQGIQEERGGVLAEDIEGNIWIGNQSGGARQILTNGMTTFDKSDGLGELRIHAIDEDQRGDMYVVNGDYFLSRFDDKGFNTVRANPPAEIILRWAENVGFLGNRNDWWTPGNKLRSDSSGVRKLEEVARRQAVLYTERNGLKSRHPYRVFEDSNSDIWISTRSEYQNLNELTRWQRSKDAFQVFSERDGLPPSIAASAFAEDKEGNLWLGFYEGGLARYAHGRFTVFTTADGAPNGSITAIYLDRADRLWIASSTGGMTRVENPVSPTPTFETYSTANGLSSNNVRCIVDDLAGNIYAGSVRGVDRLNPVNGNIHHYGPAEGLTDDLVNVAFRDRKGALWFGTPRGLSRLQPELERVRSAPPILINGLRIAGVKRYVSELGEWKIDPLELDYTQNNLQVDFFSLNFALGENIRYQFKLEGADSDWSTPSTQRTVNYPNISPGDYRFLVRAVNPDGLVSSSPAFLPFTVLKPVWLRWWFLTLAALVLGGAISGFYRYRFTKLLEIERTRTRIATDLHDDIGASLSRIAMLSEVVKRQNGESNPASAKRLTQIAEDARGVVDSMSDIVWSIDPRTDSLSSVVTRLRSFAADTLGEHGVKWSLDAAPDFDEVYLSSEHRRGLYLIFKEAVINIVRHANCRNVSFTIGLSAKNLIAEIVDDGCGLPKDSNRNSRGGRGLENMKKRAAELGGDLSICSSHEGTKMVLILPRSKNKSINMLFRRSSNEVE